MVSAASFTLGAIHLTLCFQRRRRLMHLLFVTAAFGLGGYALFERALMQAETGAEYGQLLRWAHVCVWLVLIPLALFVRSYLQTGRTWLLWSVIVTRTIALVLNFTTGVNLNYLEIGSIKRVSFLGEIVSIPVGTPNRWMLVGQAGLLLAMIYFIDAAIGIWRQGDRRRALTIGTSVAVFSITSFAISVLVLWGQTEWPLFASLFFLGMIAAMGYELTRDVQRSVQLAEDLAMSEAERKESAQQLDLSANAGHVGIWTRTLPEDKFRASDKWYELFGFSPKDGLDFAPVLERVDPADRETVRMAVETAVADGVSYEVDFQVLLPDGTSRWIGSRCIVETSKGKPSLLRGADIDITKRRLAEESKKNLAAIVESSDDAIMSKTLDGLITSWNAGAERMYGYTAEEIVGQHISVLAPDDLKGEIKGILEQIRNGASLDHLETVRLRQDGRRIDVSLTISPIRDQHGTVIGASTIGRDITTQRLTDEALRQSESRFRNMADTAPVLIWMSGPDKLCTYFNRGWLDYTGRTLEQELGNGWAGGVYGDDRALCLATYDEAFDDRKQFRMEYRLRRSDGEYRWMYDTGSPRFASDGEFLGYIGSCIDISDQKEAEAELRGLTGRLINAQEAERSRVARELHDDLSQSLALLSIQLGELDRENKEPDFIKMQVVRLTSQIQKLSLDVHRISHELHPTKLEQLGLESALRGFCREVAGTYGIKVEFAAAGLSRSLPNNISLCLYRIAQESLQNIFKHSGARSAIVNIIGEDGEIRLTVSDNGSGFDPETARSKGSLGLVSMSERIRSVDGTVTVESTIGAGTQIIARVPYVFGKKLNDR